MNTVGQRGRELAAATFLLLASIWLTWPLTPKLASSLNSSPDALLNTWALGWGLHILPQDPLSLFDANIFAPRPDTLAYSEHLFGILIIVAPVYYVSGNLVLANNLAILLSFWLCGLGGYLLVKEATGSRWGGLCAGILLLAVPFRFQHLVQIQLLSFQWLGFALWAFLRYMKDGRRRDWLLLVIFTLLQVLSCNYYAVYTALMFSIVALAALIVGARPFGWRRVLGLGGGAALVTLVSLPFLLPYERTRSEQGFYRRIEDVIHFSARPIDYLRPSSYNRAPHMDWLPRDYISERVLFPGFMALGLGSMGLLFGWPRGDLKSRESRADGTAASRLGSTSEASSSLRLRRILYLSAAGMILIGVVLSLGPQLNLGGSAISMPYRFLYRHVPGFGGMRVPARLAVLCFVGVTVLSGFGIERLSTTVAKSRSRSWVIAARALIMTAILFDVQTYSLERAFPPAPEIPKIYEWLADQPGNGAVLVLPIHEGDAITEESISMYHSTAHFKPLVNGFSGWWPNDYWELVGRLRHFPTSQSLRFLLEKAPVEYVVIHYDRLDDVKRRHLLVAMERYRERIPLQLQIGNDAIYRIVEAKTSAKDSPESASSEPPARPTLALRKRNP